MFDRSEASSSLRATDPLQTQRPLRFLLVGLGVRGRHWAEAIRRCVSAEIAAYVDSNPSTLQRARETFGHYPAYERLEDALAQESSLSAIVLATPPTIRLQHIRSACIAQLPILAEKPLATNLAEAAHIVRMTDEAGVPLMVGLNFRYLPVTLKIKEIFAKGELGRPEFARFTYERYRDGQHPDINKYPLEMEHPLLWEQSIHHFDLMRHVYRQEPVKVYCQTWNPSWSMYRHDANATAILTFSGGLIVNYHGTWAGSWGDTRVTWRTDCTQGVVLQEAQFEDLKVARSPFGELEPIALPTHEIWITETVNLLNSFVASLKGEQPLESSGRDHLKSLLMVQACIDSSKMGQVVEIDIAAEIAALGIGPASEGGDHLLCKPG